MISALTFLLAAPSAGALQTPTQACFEILADSEGEMARAQNPEWRRKAIVELAEMRAEHGRRRASIDRVIANNAKARERLKKKFDQQDIGEDDFNAARSELEKGIAATLKASIDRDWRPSGLIVSIAVPRAALDL